MQKVLSLCFPTYNRGWCMKEQIERLSLCPKETLDKMEILISDNCSTDDTQQIVTDAIANGFPATYHRNSENLGMDGNFVTCFKKAKGKYVWLLGDDDPIIIESLVKIVDKLSSDVEYGLMHIDQMKRANSDAQFVEFTNQESFFRTISYYTSLISANIVRTEYVPEINFEKYMGTWFTLIPLYITGVLKQPVNALVNFKVFEFSKDYARNGGYNYFKVFVTNYLGIWKEYLDAGKISKATFEFLKRDIFVRNISYYIVRLLILKQRGDQYKIDGAWKILFTHYWNKPYFYTAPIKSMFKQFYGKFFRRS